MSSSRLVVDGDRTLVVTTDGLVYVVRSEVEVGFIEHGRAPTPAERLSTRTPYIGNGHADPWTANMGLGMGSSAPPPLHRFPRGHRMGVGPM